MSQTRIEIQRELLHDTLSNVDGVKKAYFQPPSEAQLVYPCIIYELSDLNATYADNKRFFTFPRYTLTLIDKNPESPIQEEILNLGNGCYVQFDRFFTINGMNHWTYSLTFTKSLW